MTSWLSSQALVYVSSASAALFAALAVAIVAARSRRKLISSMRAESLRAYAESRRALLAGLEDQHRLYTRVLAEQRDVLSAAGETAARECAAAAEFRAGLERRTAIAERRTARLVRIARAWRLRSARGGQRLSRLSAVAADAVERAETNGAACSDAEAGHDILASFAQRAVSGPVSSAYGDAAALAKLALHADMAAVLVTGELPVQLRCRAGIGWSADNAPLPMALDAGSFGAWVTELDAPVVIPDLLSAGCWTAPPSLVAESVQSIVLAPIPGAASRVLGVFFHDSRAVSDADTRFLDRLATILGAAVAREESAARLEEQGALVAAFVDASPSGMVVLDALGRVEWANPAAHELFGMTADALARRRAADLFSSNGLLDVAGQVLRANGSGCRADGLALLRRADGSTLAASVTLMPVRLSDRHVTVAVIAPPARSDNDPLPESSFLPAADAWSIAAVTR